jgi:hypothetical protein
MVGGCRPAHQRPSNKMIFNNVRRDCVALLEGVLTFADLDAAALFVTHCDGIILACAVLLLVQHCLLLAACLAVVSS